MSKHRFAQFGREKKIINKYESAGGNGASKQIV